MKRSAIIAGVITFALAAGTTFAYAADKPTPKPSPKAPVVTSTTMYDTPRKSDVAAFTPAQLKDAPMFEIRKGVKISGPLKTTAKVGKPYVVLIATDANAQLVVKGTDQKFVVLAGKPGEMTAVSFVLKKKGLFELNLAGVVVPLASIRVS